jgi:hypothetical protein
MCRFPVKVEQRAEGFVVLIPAVPGCVTGGSTREEALRKAREVLQAMLIQAGPSFSPAASARPGDGADGEYVEVAAPSVPPC